MPFSKFPKSHQNLVYPGKTDSRPNEYVKNPSSIRTKYSL